MKKNENIKVKFRDLELSTFNPRFTFLENIDMDLVNFIKSGNRSYSEKSVVLKLFRNEENLQDMLNLINSIANSG